MKYTKLFIEKSLEGGWFPPKDIGSGQEMKIMDWGIRWSFDEYMSIEEILLDPKSWEAVGKVENWGECCNDCYKRKENTINDCHCGEGTYDETSRKKHEMIDALQEGMSQEQYLETLFKK